MFEEKIEAVFENGVFRPLEPVHLLQHQRVTLVLPADEEAIDKEVAYQPLPLEQCSTIRVRLIRVGDFGALPYPVELDELEQE